MNSNDLGKKSRNELIAICKEKNISGYSKLKKDEIIELLTETPTNETIEDETPLGLLQEVLKSQSVKKIATKLNLSNGTIKRWLELKDVPIQYTFDLYKLLSKDIDYTKYSTTLKDQFFTPKSLVQKCWDTFNEKTKLNLENYIFIEPSAGDGSFLNILPTNTIALDIEPRKEGITKQDYLLWKPENKDKKYIVFGNPPFGLRGHLALNFINHSFEFAEYVCFILPQLFESDGKGSPRKRVQGYNLIHSEGFSEMFYTPDNQDVKINGVFQIWSKNTTNESYKIKNNKDSKIKVYSLSDGGTASSTRNKPMIGKCDIYLPSTCFGKDNMRMYDSFENLPGKKGYGIVFIENKEEMIEKASKIKWDEISFLSTNSAYNLRTSLIESQF